MDRRLARWWGGYVRVRLKGLDRERFLNLCRSRGIELWDLRVTGEDCEGFMTVSGFFSSREPQKKSGIRLSVRKRFGLPFFLRRNRKRKAFFAGLFVCFLLLFGLSLFVWDIQVEGNRRYTADTLIRYLDQMDIRCGMRKSRVDCDRLEDCLRSDFPEITWVSARVSGTRLLIQLKENEAVLEVPVPDTAPRDLVADRDGVITDMIVRSGTPQVSVGETVTAGQVLISGIVPVTNDGGEVVAEHLVRADGDITVRREETYKREYSGLKTVEVLTGRTRFGMFLRAGNISLRLYSPPSGTGSWRTSSEERQLSLTENFFLPVWWGWIRGEEYVSYERPYTDEEKEAAREKTAAEFAENLERKGVQIERNDARIVENGSGFQIEGSAVLKEPVGAGRSIVRSEIPAVEENDRTE